MGWVTSEAPTPAELNACVQCGLCLPHCPTFRLTGRETHSPRGRLMAMSAVADGTVAVDAAFAEIMESCLQCRACETVCPSLVPFGRAMEGARAELSVQLPGPARKAREAIVGTFLAAGPVVRAVGFVGRFAASTGLDRLAPSRTRRGLAGLRPRPGVPVRRDELFPAVRERVGLVGLLAGCVMDTWFADVHRASIVVLRHAGFDVLVPAGQTCCGALAAHDGATRETRRMAGKNVAAFATVDYVVTDSAGCGAHLREYGHWADAPGGAMASRVRDISELVAEALDDGRLPEFAPDRGPVAVQDPCHLRHAQKITRPPRRVVEGAGYRPVDVDPDGMCCGAAGLYSVLRPGISSALGARKRDEVIRTGTTIVASANPGCEMQLRGHLDSHYRIVHPVELYAEALREGAPAAG